MTSRVLSLLAGAVVGVTALVGVNFVVSPSVDPSTCVKLVTSSSTEKGDLIKELAGRYNQAGRSFGSRCAIVEAHKRTSGAAMELLAADWVDTEENQPEPQVWMPSSSLWLGLLQQRGRGALFTRDVNTSLTKSPMVIAMPRPMAEALGWPTKELGWSDILDLNSRGGWASTGAQNTRWGSFTLGKDNPHRSTSGLAATIATYHAATNGDYSKLSESDTIQFVRGVEASVAYHSDDAVNFLKTLYEEDQKTDIPYISAMVFQEEMVYLYNHGAPTGDPQQLRDRPVGLKRPLVAIHPKEGTLMIDHPYLTLASATEDERAAAKDFYDFLLEPAQQERFRELGFRDRDGKGNQELVGSVGAKGDQVPKIIALPSASVVDKILQGWDLTQRRGRILLVLDMSGSMGGKFDPNRFDKPYSEPRIDLLKPAVEKQLGLLHPEDEVGLWTFSTGYDERVPIGKVGDVRDQMIQIVRNDLKPQGETALYKTVKVANEKMQREYNPKLINAIVLLTDGKDNVGGITEEQLLQEVDTTRLDNSVRIFTFAYTDDADSRVLDEIAAKSKARSYSASDPLNIDKMFVNTFSNF